MIERSFHDHRFRPFQIIQKEMLQTLIPVRNRQPRLRWFLPISPYHLKR